MATANGRRHYDFLDSVIRVATDQRLSSGGSATNLAPTANLRLDASIIKAINYHAIVGLHSDAGEYRTYAVEVGDGDYIAPEHGMVQPLMDSFLEQVNRVWETADSLKMATYALWRINHIHPFRNGNGRTARAACYFILRVKVGGPLPGKPILPELFKGDLEYKRYVEGLKQADAHSDLVPLTSLVEELVTRQITGSS